MISVNTYMNGKVKSLGFIKEHAVYTAGVLMPGQYTFTTEKEEHITVTVGPINFSIRDGEWKTCEAGETIVVPANVKFDLKVESAGSYICAYR